MALRTASPWWFSTVFVVGLLFIFVGERPFQAHDTIRIATTGLGTCLVLLLTALRTWTFVASEGSRKRVELLLLLCQLGAIAALIGYALTTNFGQQLLGIDPGEEQSSQRFVTTVTVLWAVLMAISISPLLAIRIVPRTPPSLWRSTAQTTNERSCKTMEPSMPFARAAWPYLAWYFLSPQRFSWLPAPSRSNAT